MDPTTLAIVGSVGGSLLSASGSVSEGKAALAQAKAQKAAADFQAAQLRVNAGQEQAMGQVESLEQSRQARLMQSRALAVAAASGGGASDNTVTKVIGDLAGEGELARLTAIFNGDEAARGLRNQASATEFEGRQILQAGKTAYKNAKTRALSTLLSGAFSLAGQLPGGAATGAKTAGSGGGLAGGGAPIRSAAPSLGRGR